MEETVVQGFGKTVLVTGGARSGKSRHAQALAEGALTKAHEAQRINLALADHLPAARKRALLGDAKKG